MRSNSKFISWILTSRGHRAIFRCALCSPARAQLRTADSTKQHSSLSQHLLGCVSNVPCLQTSARGKLTHCPNHLLCRCCSHVYTNPAAVSQQGQLLVSPHHSHHCTACPVNMCKRQVLQQHLHSLSSSSGQQVRVAYVGDGGNDLCPAQSLGPSDVVFVRAGYALEKLLKDPAVRATLEAQVHVWTDASEILPVLQHTKCL